MMMPFPFRDVACCSSWPFNRLRKTCWYRITGNAVGLHPLGAMFALLAGLQLAGLLGGLFAVPLAGVLGVLVGAGYRNVVAEPPARRHRFFPVPGFRRPARRPATSA